MKITHKRKVQSKLHKCFKATATKVNVEVVKADKPVKVAQSIKNEVVKAAATISEIALTPKQQIVFDIVCQHPAGLNSKEIGVLAGQEEAKAAAWATGGLKKLVEENLVVREQLTGNKVIYKAA